MVKILLAIVRFCYVTSKLGAILALLLIIMLNCANLISRWFFFHSFDWVLEASLIMFVYSVMLAIPVIYHDTDFIRMHLMDELLGERGSRFLHFVSELLILAFMSFLLYFGFSLSLGQFDTLSRGLGIPRFYVTIPLSIGAGACLPIGLKGLLESVAVLRETDRKRSSSGSHS
jgi:TRAP-type C4-dicarboxylate transport system permease small subunit